MTIFRKAIMATACASLLLGTAGCVTDKAAAALGARELLTRERARISDQISRDADAARSPHVVDITAGPNQGARSCYMADPDGYAVELFQKRPGA